MDTGVSSTLDTVLPIVEPPLLGKRVSSKLTRKDTLAVDALVDLSDRILPTSLAKHHWDAFLPASDSPACNVGSAAFFGSPVVVSPPDVLVPQAPLSSPPHAVCHWEHLVKQDFVNLFISSQPSISPEQEVIMALRLKAFDTPIDKNELRKLCVIENVFTTLMETHVQDTRLLPTGSDTAPVRYIIEVDELQHGTFPGFLQPFRCFTVNDPFAFNLIVREMQDKHPSFKSSSMRPRTTKPTSEVLARIGIGPPYNVAPHYAYKIRGPRETDPRRVHPDTGEETKGSDRDGMYYTRYEYSFLRLKMLTTRSKHGQSAKRSKHGPPVDSVSSSTLGV